MAFKKTAGGAERYIGEAFCVNGAVYSPCRGLHGGSTSRRVQFGPLSLNPGQRPEAGNGPRAMIVLDVFLKRNRSRLMNPIARVNALSKNRDCGRNLIAHWRSLPCSLRQGSRR